MAKYQRTLLVDHAQQRAISREAVLKRIPCYRSLSKTEVMIQEELKKEKVGTFVVRPAPASKDVHVYTLEIHFPTPGGLMESACQRRKIYQDSFGQLYVEGTPQKGAEETYRSMNELLEEYNKKRSSECGFPSKPAFKLEYIEDKELAKLSDKDRVGKFLVRKAAVSGGLHIYTMEINFPATGTDAKKTAVQGQKMIYEDERGELYVGFPEYADEQTHHDLEELVAFYDGKKTSNCGPHFNCKPAFKLRAMDSIAVKQRAPVTEEADLKRIPCYRSPSKAQGIMEELKRQPVGTFVVRDATGSHKRHIYSMDIKFPAPGSSDFTTTKIVVEKSRICKNDKGRLYVGNPKATGNEATFENLKKLVDYYNGKMSRECGYPSDPAFQLKAMGAKDPATLAEEKDLLLQKQIPCYRSLNKMASIEEELMKQPIGTFVVRMATKSGGPHVYTMEIHVPASDDPKKTCIKKCKIKENSDGEVHLVDYKNNAEETYADLKQLVAGYDGKDSRECTFGRLPRDFTLKAMGAETETGMRRKASRKASDIGQSKRKSR